MMTAMITLLLLFNVAAAQTVKIATYNIFFLDDGITSERKVNLQGVIKLLDADVIAFQEINNSAALRNILSPDYQVAMIDEPEEVQEVALAIRSPWEIFSSKNIFPESYYDLEFPRKRDLLQVNVTGLGYEFVFLVHHAKSRGGGRYNTDTQRGGAAKLIMNYVKTELANKNVVLLGDFNDNPDDRSLNILEYGNVNARGGVDEADDTFLYNATEQLLEKDYASYGYHDIYTDISGETFDPVVKGARDENNKWRDVKEYNFYEDVNIKAILFDQVLVSLNLKPYITAVDVFNYAVAVKGNISNIRFDKGNLIYTHRGNLPSDHVPVWIILDLPEHP
jgi:endonuclease/exonuclease/phosphatase family metal-dependent hydrolase